MMEKLPAVTPPPGIIEIVALYPDMIISGSLKEGTTIDVGQLLKHFDLDIPSPNTSLQIVALDFSANPQFQTYSISGTIENVWPLNLGFTTLKIDSLTISVDYTKNDIAADFLGIITIFDVDFIVEAKRPAGGAGWFFSGKLDPNTPIKLVDIVNDFIVASGSGPIDVTSNGLDGLQIQQLGFSVDTGTSAYTFDGAASWTVPMGDVESFTVQAALDVARTSGQPATGKISASLFLNDFSFGNLAVTVFFTFETNNKELGFTLKKGDAELDATLDWGPGQDTILTVQLDKVSVGDILSFLVNLVDPYLDFHLDPPWDILETWQIDNLTLTIDITTRTVSVAYTGTIDLVFMQISKLALTYATVNGESSVTIALDGTFLGEPLANPMTWDALNDSPPAVPGKGGKIFDLQYLGLGQHVSLATTQGLDTMQEVIAALGSTVLPVQSTGKNPLTQLPGIVFNPNSGWLIGAKFVVIDTVELDLIFNDPVLYGLLIRLFGEKAKIFAGLEFQILYRKVSDTVGVYHIELKLPDEMRNLEFGEVSITLPVIILDIFTNGDFRIDVGFPANGDFSQSFTVQAFPFIGAGGFYFAKLSAETATNLPAIINGTFNPVIEFGIGLQLGVGKDINEGILSAGFSITVEGILEGTIAWFQPKDNTTPSDQYYLLKGALTIVGHVYGTVNFAIIQASVDIMVYAGIQAVIEAYQPIYIDLVAGVEVSLSIKILFITIHLSFSATISEHFAIGSASPTPWILASGPQQSRLALLAAEVAPLSFAERMASVELAVEVATPGLNWAPLEVWTTPKTLNILFQPSYTVALAADDPAVKAANGATATEAKGVALLFVANSMSPDLSGAAALDTVADGDGTGDFAMLAQTILAWAVYAYLGGAGGQVNANPTPCQSSNNAGTTFSPWVLQTSVTLDQLQSLHDALASGGGSPLFALGDLEALFQQNFCFNIAPAGAAISATFFPMFPELSLTYDGTTIDFSANPLSPDYLTDVQQFVQQLQVDYQNSVAQPPGRPQKTVEVTDGGESMATFVFLDYFAILVRGAVQSAIDYLGSQSASTIGLATLLTGLAQSSTLNNTAGMVSRFLLHGLRLPAPSGPSNATSALFELTGQQFTIPTPVPTGFTLTLSTRANWIEFTQQAVIGPQLSYPLSATEIALVQSLAAVSFEPTIQSLAPLQLYQLADKRFTFQHTIPWQTDSPLRLCGAPGTTTPTIWPFPDNLLAELTNAETTPLTATPYIGTPSNTGPQGMQETPVSCFAWASYIPVRLKPVNTLKNTYLLLGTDEPGRHLLEDLLAYLDPQSGHNLAGTSLSIYLLSPPSAATPSPVSTDMGASGLLVKTNLSTMSTSGQAQVRSLALAREAAAEADGTPYSAMYGPGVDLTQATDFVRLLWECSVVNTGGYYFQYLPSSQGVPLPVSLFADGDIATLSMLLAFENANPQQPVPSLQTDVYRFHNALIIQDEINTSTSVVFATADDITVKTAVVPPGTVGFQMVRAPKAAEDPAVTQPPVDPHTAGIKLDYLYNLLGYQVNANSFFQASGEGMPVGPAQSQTASSSANSATWNYNRVVPFYQLAASSSGTDGGNLPPASKDPYNGISQGAQLNLSFTFHDMFGNRTLEQPSAPSLPPVPVGYTDPVVGLSSWPSLATTYDFSPVSSITANLTIDARFDGTKYIPGTGQTLAGCLNQAAVDQVAYARIYYQIQQSDVGFVLSTTVDQSAAHPLDRDLLSTLVTDIYSYLGAVLTSQPAVYPVTSEPPVSLDTIAQLYSVSGADVAQVNSATANIYPPGTSLTIPCNYRVRASDSFEAIAAFLTEALHKVPPMTALDVATDGLTLTTLLRPGAQIYTGTNTTYQLKGGETLADIANAFPYVTPGDVAQTNAGHALTGNMSITIRNTPQPISPGQSLTDLVNAYNATHSASQQPPLTAYEIGTTNATTVINLFQGTTPPQIPVKYQIAAGDSLARIYTAYGVALGDLLAANPEDTTLLTQGALIPITAETYQVVAGDSLNGIVQRANAALNSTQFNGTPIYAPIAVSDLAGANAGVPLNPQMGPDPNRPTVPAPVPMLVPFALTLPAPASSSNVLHLIGESDTLEKIASGNVTAADLVTANQDTLGILSAGKTVTVGGIRLTVQQYDTFRTLVNRFNASFAITAQTIANLTANGVPGAIVQKLTGLQGQVFSSETAFVTALTATIGAQDAALYLLPLLRYAGMSVTAADLAQPPNSTETGLLAQGQAMLVSPQPLVTSVSISLTQHTYPAAPIFPVTAQIAISRDKALIHPDFADAPEVQSASTLLAPNLVSAEAGGSLSLVQFAQQFESAFTLKLATGSETQLRYPDTCGPQTVTTDDSGDQDQPQHLWAVNLGNGGINYTISQAPVYFTIAPLATTLLGTPLTPTSPTTIAIDKYTSGQGLQPGGGTSQSFKSIDLGVWATSFLAAVDQFLAPEFAVPAFSLPDPNATQSAVNILNAKEQLATTIAEQILPVYAYSSSYYAPFQLQNLTSIATDTLEQQLLITLSAGYAVDTIVVFGVTVQSTCPNADTAPRFSGRPVAGVYTTVENDTLQNMGQSFAVEMPYTYVAETIQSVQNILAPGTTVSGYTITTGDTVSTIATQLKTTVDAVAEAMQQAGQSYFKANVKIPMAQYTCVTTNAPTNPSASQPIATVNAIAEYFQVTLVEVVDANQYVPSLLRSGQKIQGKSTSYTTQENDTLADVIKAFGGDAAAIEQVAAAIATQTNLLMPNVTVAVLQIAPAYTISTAKVPLNNGTSYLPFLFTTQTPTAESRVFLDLVYQINEMEYDIGSLPGIEGYQDSSWLTFIIPLDASDPTRRNVIGEVDIPVPLRAYPTPPALVSQQVVTPQISQLADVKQWQYGYTYEHVYAAQDAIETAVRYNLPPDGLQALRFTGESQPARNLFEALANFTQVYPDILADLAQLPGWTPGASNTSTLSLAVQAFQQLVTDVSQAWQAWTEVESVPSGTDADYIYEVLETFDGDNLSVNVTLTDVARPFAPAMPQISVPGYSPDGTPKPQPPSAEYEYTKLSDPAQQPSIPQVTVTMPSMDVLDAQNAWGSIWLSRNKNLSPAWTTNPNLVYQTPEIGFQTITVPLLTNSTEWRVGTVNVHNGQLDTAGLRAVLASCFQTLLTSNTPGARNVKLSCSYAFAINAAAGDDLLPSLPVVLVPSVSLTLSDPAYETFLDQLAQAVTVWHNTNQPSTTGASYIFSLSAFSNLSQNNAMQPLLQVTDLLVAIQGE